MDIQLDTEVRAALESRRGDWARIAKEAEVSHSWISQFVRNKIPNPGYRTLKRLQRELSHQTLAKPTETHGPQASAPVSAATVSAAPQEVSHAPN